MVLIGSMIVTGCAGQATKPIAGNDSLYRTESQRHSLELKAQSGDGGAAYQLSLFYGLVQYDEKRRNFWLEKAVQLKYPPAMISLANDLDESVTTADRRRARRLRAEAHALKFQEPR
jgi:hypothetical protein